jgi:hypothetical protein
MPRLRINGALPLLPLYAFMACKGTSPLYIGTLPFLDSCKKTDLFLPNIIPKSIGEGMKAQRLPIVMPNPMAIGLSFSSTHL